MLLVCCLVFVLSLISIAGTIIWIWSLIDVITRDESEFKNKNDKLMWVLLIILIGWIASIIYYFLVYKNFEKK